MNPTTPIALLCVCLASVHASRIPVEGTAAVPVAKVPAQTFGEEAADGTQKKTYSHGPTQQTEQKPETFSDAFDRVAKTQIVNKSGAMNAPTQIGAEKQTGQTIKAGQNAPMDGKTTAHVVAPESIKFAPLVLSDNAEDQAQADKPAAVTENELKAKVSNPNEIPTVVVGAGKSNGSKDKDKSEDAVVSVFGALQATTTTDTATSTTSATSTATASSLTTATTTALPSTTSTVVTTAVVPTTTTTELTLTKPTTTTTSALSTTSTTSSDTATTTIGLHVPRRQVGNGNGADGRAAVLILWLISITVLLLF